MHAHSIEAQLRCRWRTWFVEDALPFWRRQLQSATAGLFWERLHLDGTPDRAATLRVRTQARQIYAFSHATVLGLEDDGFAFVRPVLLRLHRYAWAPDGAVGWVHRLHPDGSVADDCRDLYDHAFILLMLAYAHRADPGSALDVWIEQTLAAVDDLFAASHGGYAETGNGDLPRRQNPHMHLFEAFLALFESTGEAAYLARAGEIFGLFRTRFFSDHDDTLREFFTADWQGLGDDGGNVLEPGHFAEWVWLLRRYERLSGRPVADLCGRLLRAAERLGRDAATGFLLDEIAPNNPRSLGTRRLWPQTEYLKALIVEARAGDTRRWSQAAQLSDDLFKTYLTGVSSGAWRDRFRAEGEIAVDHVPASTLYHLFGVYATLVEDLEGLESGCTDLRAAIGGI